MQKWCALITRTYKICVQPEHVQMHMDGVKRYIHCTLGLSRIRNFTNRFDSYKNKYKNLDFWIISIQLLGIDYLYKFYLKLIISNTSKIFNTWRYINFITFIGIQRKVIKFWSLWDKKNNTKENSVICLWKINKMNCTYTTLTGLDK
jgi:hypothetical protein